MAGGRGRRAGGRGRSSEGATATPAAARATTTTPAASSTAASPDDATEAAVAAEGLARRAAEPAANGDPAPLAAESDALSAPSARYRSPMMRPPRGSGGGPSLGDQSAASAAAPAAAPAPRADVTTSSKAGRDVPPAPARDPPVTEPSKSVAFFDRDHTIIDANGSVALGAALEMNNGRVGALRHAPHRALAGSRRYAADAAFGARAERAGAEAARALRGHARAPATSRPRWRRSSSARWRPAEPGCVSAMAAHASRRERCVRRTTSWQHPAQSRGAAVRPGEREGGRHIERDGDRSRDAGLVAGKIAKVAYGDGKYHDAGVVRAVGDRDRGLHGFHTDSMSHLCGFSEHVGRRWRRLHPTRGSGPHAQKRAATFGTGDRGAEGEEAEVHVPVPATSRGDPRGRPKRDGRGFLFRVRGGVEGTHRESPVQIFLVLWCSNCGVDHLAGVSGADDTFSRRGIWWC